MLGFQETYQMRTNPDLVLFEDKVYATEPDQSTFGGDILYFYMLDTEGDNIHYIIENPKKESARTPQQIKPGFYLCDETITRQRFDFWRSKRKTSSRLYDLKCSRKIIVDDAYPVHVEYLREFKRWTGKRKMALTLGDYQITFGRRRLVEMIGDAKYEEALPELTEIVLHDNNFRMKVSSLDAIRDIQSKKTSIFLKKILEENSKFSLFSKILGMIENFPDEQLLPPIKKLLEKHYDYFPVDYMEAITKTTIQQEILEAVSKIKSIKAFEILLMGIESQYEHVEQTALKYTRIWARMMVEEIVKKNMDMKTARFISTVLKTFDVRIYNESYRILKKAR